MKIGATKITEVDETKRLFNAATAAVLMNVGKFCTIAIDAANSEALVNLGGAAMQLINNALEQIERAKQNEQNQMMN